MSKKKGKCATCGGSTSNKKAINCISCRREELKRRMPKQEYARKWQMWKKYKLTQDEFDLLWQVFRGKCGICERELTLPKHGRGQPRNAAVVDHNHDNGIVRGILCNSCNKALGLFDESVVTLQKALKWIGYKNAQACNNS